MPVDQVSETPPDRLFDPVIARAEHLTPGEPRVLSKKEEWLREKALRPDVHVVGRRPRALVDPQPRRARAPAGEPRERAAERSRALAGRADRAGHHALQHLDARGAADSSRRGARDRQPLPHLPARSLHQPGHAHGRAAHRRPQARGGKVFGAADRGRLGLPLAEVQPDAAQEGASGRAPQPAHGRARRRLPHPRRRHAARCFTTSAPCTWAASASTPTRSSSTATPARPVLDRVVAAVRARSALSVGVARALPGTLASVAGGQPSCRRARHHGCGLAWRSPWNTLWNRRPPRPVPANSDATASSDDRLLPGV